LLLLLLLERFFGCAAKIERFKQVSTCAQNTTNNIAERLKMQVMPVTLWLCS